MLRRATAALVPRLLQQQGGAGAAPLAAAATHVPAFNWGDDKPAASSAQVFRREWVGPGCATSPSIHGPGCPQRN